MQKNWIWTPLIAIALAVAAYALYRALQPPPLPEGIAYGNGHVEGTEVRVAAEVGGRVVEHALNEGRAVTAGEQLLVIDAQSSLDALAAVQREAEALRRSAAALDAQIGTWTHHLQTARDQLERVRSLVANKTASRQSLDTAQDAARQAEGELQRLRAQREALQAQVGAAEARVSIAQTQVGRNVVTAPRDGTILVRAVETGEVVQAGQPLALLVDLQRLELKVYLPAEQAGKVPLQAPARVRVDAHPDRWFDARVTRLDDYAQFTPRDIHVPAERTQMVYGVVLALSNRDGLLKPGTPADAWIRLHGADGDWPASLPVPRN